MKETIKHCGLQILAVLLVFYPVNLKHSSLLIKEIEAVLLPSKP